MSDIEADPRPRRRAVQYLRMSTDHQRYSIERQSVAIAEYAQARGFEIVRTYADPGKSGLSLKGRKALQQLLADTLSPTRDFSAILVLDVSRWGRFQDPDQAAHYEFICKQAGARIEYCMEPFENDGSITNSIVKVIKRMMAGEYSRDLSAEISAATARHASRGRVQGQHTPYAIRRQLIGPDGRPIQIMEAGDRKILSGSWVRWVPGPEHEIRAVRAIFEMYVRRRIPMQKIVNFLNKTPMALLNSEWVEAVDLAARGRADVHPFV